jgi:hypothetical protein
VQQSRTGELSEADLEVARDQLIGLIGDANRDLIWLEQQMPRSTILHVLSRFAPDFLVEDLDRGNKLISLAVPDCVPVPEPAVAKELMPSRSPQDCAPAEGPPLSEVLDEETIAEMKFKPAAPGMGSRRNDRRTMRGDRFRIRRPLVTL